MAHGFLAIGLLFFFVYSIAPDFLPIQSKRIITGVGLLALLAVWILKGRGPQLDSLTLAALALLVAPVAWAGLGTARTGFEDVGYLAGWVLLNIETLLGAAVIAWVLSRRLTRFAQLIRLVHITILLQAGFVLLSLVSPSFRQITAEWIPARGNIHALDPIRVRGLTHSSGAHLSALQGVGFLCIAYLHHRTPSTWGRLFLWGSAPLLLVSVLATGRTGFIVIPLALALWALPYIYRGRLSRKAVGWASAGAVLVLIVVAWSLVDWGPRRFTGTASTAEFALEEAQKRLQKDLENPGGRGLFRSRTVQVLLGEMWFYPQDDGVFLLGDVRLYSQVGSDLGVIRHLHSSGLWGLILVYGSVLFLFIVTSSRLSGPYDRLFLWVYFVWLAMLEFKEPLMHNHLFGSLYFLMFWIAHMLWHRRKRAADMVVAAPATP